MKTFVYSSLLLLSSLVLSVILVGGGGLLWAEGTAPSQATASTKVSTKVSNETNETYAFVTAWGETGSGDGQFQSPNSVAVDASGFVYVVDARNARIQKFTSAGTFVTKWGEPGNDPGQFEGPLGVAVDSQGFVYVADGGNDRVQKFTPNGILDRTWGRTGSADKQFNNPAAVAFDPKGFIYVADRENYRLQKFGLDGEFDRKWGEKGSGDGQFEWLSGLAVDAQSYVYASDPDQDNHRVQKFDEDGKLITIWGEDSPLGKPWEPLGLTVNAAGAVYVADVKNHCLHKFTSKGILVLTWGSEGSGEGQFRQPSDVAVDAAGFVYVADKGNDRIQKFKPVLDVAAPSSSVTALPLYQTSTSFPVRWSGWDDASGIASYDVQYRAGTGAWTDWQISATHTSTVFSGAVGQTYYFQCRATDHSGRVESYPAGDGDTHTTIVNYLLGGTVESNRGTAVLSAMVSSSPTAPGPDAVQTDGAGAFSIGLIEAGTYALTASHPNFGTLPAMTLNVGGDVSGLRFVLPPLDNTVTDWGFESGNLSGWTAGGAVVPVITTESHTGGYAARFPLGAGQATLSQTVTISGETPTLSFLYRATGGELGSDILRVVAGGLVYSLPVTTTDWTHTWHDLSGGQTVELRFEAVDSAGTDVYLDEVSLGTGAAQPPRIYLPLTTKGYGVP